MSCFQIIPQYIRGKSSNAHDEVYIFLDLRFKICSSFLTQYFIYFFKDNFIDLRLVLEKSHECGGASILCKEIRVFFFYLLFKWLNFFSRPGVLLFIVEVFGKMSDGKNRCF